MRWFLLGAVVLSVLVLSGCPSEFGKDGRVGKAVHQDAQNQLGIRRCSDAYKKEVCEGPSKDPEKCRKCP